MMMPLVMPSVLVEDGCSGTRHRLRNMGERVARLRGRVKCFDADLLDALCDVLEVIPDELFESRKR